ncbi:response regulator [Alkalihalobacillus sp. TS-13]|uniref:response regulator transcription factor n=1 Tax=Alkalihalobacillus sp. TS-13 TaxID=2842455 RepID=UPI001C883871|nr:response regulator [Alkalihalobacillus sp. TS-13]
MYTAIVVDDEKMIKRSIVALIQSNDTGFEIVGEAKDGIDAIELNERYSPDLIITDIRMPKLNGLKFIERVKETNTRSKFIIISGYDEFEYAQTAIRYGVIDFLLKPLKPDQFLSSLKKVHEHLDTDRKPLKDRNEWLWEIKSFVENLVQVIWLLEEEQVRDMLEVMYQKIIEQEQDNEYIKGLYIDMVVFIKGEVNKQMGSKVYVELVNESLLPDDPIEMNGYVYTICNTIMHQLKMTRNIGQRNNIISAVKYIDSNYREENLNLQLVANSVNMSPSYFSMEFKAEMGISFIQYITKKRIELAKELLNNPSYKTYEIAHTIGYNDYPHFTKTFKKHVGITPSQFRKRIGVH